MGMITRLWAILTTSKGTKRTVAIVMFALAYAAGKIGIGLPEGIEQVVTNLVEGLAVLVGLVGVGVAKVQERKKASVKASIIEKRPELKTIIDTIDGKK